MIFIKSTESVVNLAVKGGGQHREQHFSLEFLSLLSSLSLKNKKKEKKNGRVRTTLKYMFLLGFKVPQ